MDIETQYVFMKNDLELNDSLDDNSKFDEDDYYGGDFIAEDFVQVKLDLEDESDQSHNSKNSKSEDKNTDVIEIVESGVFNNPRNQPLDLKAVSIVQSIHSIHLQRNKCYMQSVLKQKKDNQYRKNKRPEYYICEYCGKYFKNNSHYHRHVRLHTTGGSHKCEECGKYYTSKETLLAHVKSHTELEPDPVTCPLCQTVYKHSDSFRRHYRRRHINAGIFQCSFCDKICSTKEAIKKHLERHKLIKNKFQCPKCEKDFVEFSKLKLHMQTHNEIYKFTCDQCNKRFIDENNLKVHIKSEHQERPFVCQVCFHDFNSLRRLKSHVTSHFREKKFTCHLCPKAFDSKSPLEDHIRFHNGELPFQCEHCLKKFSARKRLRCHMTIQHRENLYSCPFCSMVFISEKSLEAHRDSHKETQSSHICKECGKIFVCEMSLKQHMKLHNQGGKFNCEFCYEKFKNKLSLRKHKEKSCKAHLISVSGSRPYEKEMILSEKNDEKHFLKSSFQSKTDVEENHFILPDLDHISNQVDQLKKCDNEYNRVKSNSLKDISNSTENTESGNGKEIQIENERDVVTEDINKMLKPNVNYETKNVNNDNEKNNSVRVDFENEISRGTDSKVSIAVGLNTKNLTRKTENIDVSNLKILSKSNDADFIKKAVLNDFSLETGSEFEVRNNTEKDLALNSNNVFGALNTFDVKHSSNLMNLVSGSSKNEAEEENKLDDSKEKNTQNIRVDSINFQCNPKENSHHINGQEERKEKVKLVQHINSEEFLSTNDKEINTKLIVTEIDYNSFQENKQVEVSSPRVNASCALSSSTSDDILPQKLEGINNSTCEIGEIKYKLWNSRSYTNKKDRKITSPRCNRQIDNDKIMNSNHNSSPVEKTYKTQQMLNSSTNNIVDHGIEHNLGILSQSQYKANVNNLMESHVNSQKFNDRNKIENNFDASRNSSIQQYHKIKAKLCQMESDSETDDSDTERQIKRIKLKRLQIENSKRNDSSKTANLVKQNLDKGVCAETALDCRLKQVDKEPMLNMNTVFQNISSPSSQSVQNLYEQQTNVYPLFTNNLTTNYMYDVQHHLVATQNELSKMSFLAEQSPTLPIRNNLLEQSNSLQNNNAFQTKLSCPDSLEYGNYSNSLIFKDTFKS